MYEQKKCKQQLALLKTEAQSLFQPIQSMQIWEDRRSSKLTIPDSESDWHSIKIGDSWSGRDQYYWLRFSVTIPHLANAQQYGIYLDLGRTGGGNNSGFEGLIYVDRQIVQAVDRNHKLLLLDSTYSDRVVQVAILMWTGLEGGGPIQLQHYVLKAAEAGYFSYAIDQAQRWLQIISKTCVEFSDDEPLKYKYMDLLDRSLTRFHWGLMTHSQIENECEQVLQDIFRFCKQHDGEKKDYQVSVIGHTHIDVAWLWRYRHTREKVTRSFATALNLMDHYPDFKFIHSSPQVYQWLKKDQPILYERVKTYVHSGRWEADGGTWLEADTNLPSGESLTRQFLYGTRFFSRELGSHQTVLWLPDAFGYSWALPQIMAGFGIHNFMTTKISWNDTNRMPHDTFLWQGIDGTKVLTHFITTVEDNLNFRDPKNWQYTYSGKLTPHTVFGSYHVYADKALNNNLLLAYGHGDGGGGPEREMIENAEIMDRLPGLPHIKQVRVNDYFSNLRYTLKNNRQPLPVWNGELYLEYHRGTYTSQARVKRENRQLEYRLRKTEMSSVNAMFMGIPYPQKKFNQLWTILLRNQFHDVLPGSAIHEVYQDNAHEYHQIFHDLDAIDESNNQILIKFEPDTYTISNSNGWQQQGLVTIKRKDAGHFVDDSNQRLRQQVSGGAYQILVTVPALGMMNIHFVSEEPRITAKDKIVDTLSNTLENNRYLITWNTLGQLTRIYDKVANREVLAKGAIGNQLTVYEDRPTEYDNWNIDRDYPEKAITLESSNVKIERNILTQRATFTYHFNHSTIFQSIILNEFNNRIDFDTHADWHDHHFLLRTAFPVNILSDHARYDIQYGNVSRSTSRNTSWEEAKFETVAHKWADLSQSNYGVALLNDSKYGYAVFDHTLSLSLIKSGTNPDVEADQGNHHFTYSLLPHQGDFIDANIEARASELNQPLTLTAGRAVKAMPLFTFDSQHPVAVDAIKHSEDGNAVILRLHDYTGGEESISITPHFNFVKCMTVRLDETHLKVVDSFQFTLKPYQILTLAFTLSDKGENKNV